MRDSSTGLALSVLPMITSSRSPQDHLPQAKLCAHASLSKKKNNITRYFNLIEKYNILSI